MPLLFVIDSVYNLRIVHCTDFVLSLCNVFEFVAACNDCRLDASTKQLNLFYSESY